MAQTDKYFHSSIFISIVFPFLPLVMPPLPVSEEEFDLGAASDHSSDAELETQLEAQEWEAGIRAVPSFDPDTAAFPVLKAVRFFAYFLKFFL